MIKRGRRLRTIAVTIPAAALLASVCAPAQAATSGPGAGAATGVCGSSTTCYTPQQLQVAYGVKPLLDRG
jgi:uncharacterized protein YggE